MNKDKRNNIKLLGTLNNADESGIIANANQIYDANEDKSTQDISKEHKERIKTLETKENSMQTTLENITKTGEASAASNVTYNHSDSKLDATNVQQAIDEVSSIRHFTKKGGSVNVSTNYNSEHTAEVLTLAQALSKVPNTDRVLGFQGKYLASDGWHTIIYIGDSLTSWSDITKWIDLSDKILKSISKNATFAGIATLTTNPGTPDGPVFYIATEPGIYPNFNGIEVATGEAVILQWNDGAWTKKITGFATEQEIIYDVSARNGGVVFESLQALLSSSNLNTLIPPAVRCGGMSIRFIQGSVPNSDNKYVQWRLIKTTWSTTVSDWSFCEDDVIVEELEWIRVITDADGRILFGIKIDGSIEWSIGIPTPVKEYVDNAITEIKNGVEGTDLDGLHKIIAFLDEFSTSDTLKNLLDIKVDKEEGKSLIDAEYANGISYVENPEWIKVLTDKNGKILYAIKPDGTVNWYIEIPDKIKNYIDTLVPVSVSEIDSEEFVYFVRSNQNVLLSIDKYGECFVTKLRTKTIESETTNDIINNVKNNTAAITSSLKTAKNYTDAQVSAEATQRNNQITDVDNALRTLINEAETEVQDGEITVSKLAQDVLDLINSSGGGTITNAADEEDLTTVDNKLKFKDRPVVGTSLGYTILRNSFTVSEDVTLDANKIYKIRHSINLNQHTLTVPSGTILDFDGGYLYNGTINGNGGCIKASGYKIFGNITIAGQFANKFKIEWFGAIPSGTVDSSTAINAAINSGALELCGDGNLYYLASPVNLNKGYIKLEFLGNVKVARDCNGFVISKSNVDLKIKRLYAANTPTGGDSSLSSGLLLTGNCYNSTININHIFSFGKGINLCPDVNQTEVDYSGIQYCKFYFQYINCMECIVFDVRNSSIWINENSFFGGRLTGGIGIKQYGTRTTCLDGNKFEFVRFEGLTSMIMDGIYGWSNGKFIHCRMSTGENTAASPYIVMSNSENINIEIEGELNAATYIDCAERNNSNILIKTGAKYNYYQQNSVKNLTLEEIFNSLTK